MWVDDCTTGATSEQVLTEYFKELEEESIRDNFVIVYELLDEMMDFGYPQTTESKILQEYITQESYKLESQARPPMAVTNAVSWRSEGIRYRKNEVFLDVVESVNLLVNSNGSVVRSEILGAVKMKCYLSGMPELRLGLNDKVMFESTGRSEFLARVAVARAGLTRCLPPIIRSITRKGHRDGGRQVPPMCAAVAVRERPDNQLHPARRRIRAHVVPPQHASQAAHLGGSEHRDAFRKQDGVCRQGESAVQAAVDRKQCRDLRASSGGRRFAALPGGFDL